MDDAEGEDYPPLIHKAGCATMFVADHLHELELQGKGGPIQGGNVWAVHLQPQQKNQNVNGKAKKVARVSATAYRVSAITEDEESAELRVVMEGERDNEHSRPVILGAIRPDHCRGMWALVVKESEAEALDCKEIADACVNWLRHGYWIEYGEPPGE